MKTFSEKEWAPIISTNTATMYRGTSLTRDSSHVGLYSRATPRALRWCKEGSAFLMSEVPLCAIPETFFFHDLGRGQALELNTCE
jgi:hypothetical protein